MLKKIVSSQSLIYSPSLTAISVWESSGCLAFNFGPLDFVKSMYADRGCFGTWSLYWSGERERKEGGGKEGGGVWERREGEQKVSSRTLYRVNLTFNLMSSRTNWSTVSLA